MFELGIVTTDLERKARTLARAADFVMPEIRKGAQDAGRVTRDGIRSFTPVDKGLTRDSVGTAERRISTNEVVVGIVAVPIPGRPANLFQMLNDGTRPHEIRPRFAKVLRFTSGGQTFFRPRVQHPGTRAYRQVEKGLKASEAARARAWRNTVRRIQNRMRGRGSGDG